MTPLNPSQIVRFQKLAEAVEKAPPSQREALLAAEKDPLVVRWVRLAMAWGPDPAIDLGKLSGRVIGKYTLKQRLGEGGFGIVYEAEEDFGKGRKVRVAIKFLRPELCRGDALQLFQDEVGHLVELAGQRNPGLVRVLGHGEFAAGPNDGPPRVPYVVTEFVSGKPLDAFLPRASDWRAKVELFVKVCEAVQALHLSDPAGRVHSDLKPANILVDDKGQPVILDYGLAQVLNPFVSTASLGGTVTYLAPEQLADRPTLDVRSDVYTLGVILFQLLVGRLPYPRAEVEAGAVEECIRLGKLVTLRSEQSDLPVALDRVVAKALRLKPADRYASAAAFGNALATLIRPEGPAKGSKPKKVHVDQQINVRGGNPTIIHTIKGDFHKH